MMKCKDPHYVDPIVERAILKSCATTYFGKGGSAHIIMREQSIDMPGAWERFSDYVRVFPW